MVYRYESKFFNVIISNRPQQKSNSDVCGKKDCYSRECPERPTRDFKDWHINQCKEVQEAQNLLKTIQEDVAGKDDQDSISGESKKAWFNFMHVMVHAAAKEDTRDWIILDSGSSTDLFCNMQYVDNIRQTSKV